ncbi:uncharacterized protein LOC125771260 isoform X4 [Anopheles funestus]|uniref:uncharacterized protein LOC125771260 isoform X4 n=1 Tax=Anopheles funestus TaxID=62324 RepID=UPI0020C6A7E5|nr:uncharacterized protein LOC125771260 isoform X4 [Anopheles funestus]
MFSCLWQLWDWIDPPTFTTMESKKLQQLQQANSHLAPMPQMKPPQGGGFQHPPPGGYDYGATAAAPGRSSMFPPNASQYQGYGQHPSSLRSPYSTGSPKSSLSTNSGALYGATDMGDLSSTSGGPSYHMPPGQQGLLLPHQQQFRSNTLGPGGYGYDHQQQLYRVSSPSSGSGGAASGERERLYQTAPLVRSGVPGTPHSVTSGMSSNAPMSKLELQFQQLQREKIQQQIKTATEAIAHQQQTFALRQQLNPPVPNYHLKQNLLQNLSQHHQQQIQQQQQQQQQQPQPQNQLQVHKHPQYPAQQQQQKQLAQQHQQKQHQHKQQQQQMQHAMKQQQQQHQQQQQQQQHQQSRYSASGGSANRNAPPSSLNLLNHCQPAGSETDKIMRSHVPSYHGTVDTTGAVIGLYGEEESLYHQKSGYPQGITSPPGANSEIIIQQNIPGQVVNQACQTQISSMVLAGNSGVAQQSQQQQQQQVKSSPSDTLSSPSHDSSERRRGGSGQQHTLKSPVTKRPANAPVALSGWLYKQGSDGLKVWRRRWFVLSEYVLYYYKGQEEEKLLGTVLLPSYKVSACFPEDKIYRKFAFKCEHANMRTFVFAAENGESMSQWVRALTLATMMIQHVGSEQEANLNLPKGSVTTGELLSSDSSGTGGPQSQGSNDTMKLIQQANGNGSSSSSGAGTSGLNDSMSLPQPLYANAPPKPRRVNDAGYSSPSPEHTMLQDRYEQLVQHQQMMFPGVASGPQGGGMVLGNNRTPAALTAQAIYGDPKRIERDLYIQKLIEQQQQQQQLNAAKQQQQQQQQQQNLGIQSSPMHGQVLRSTPGAGTNPFLYPSNDRRTPDTYGPPNAAIDPKHMSDYEDIYNLTMLSKSLPSNAAGPMEGMGGEGGGTVAGGTCYKRPSSPLRYESNGAFPAYMGNSLYNAGQFEHPLTAGAAPLPQHVQMRARPIPPNIPRPHSADFLDYEARHPLNQTVSGANDEPSPVHRTPRPKSSLDINRTPDHYYYSEASYAEKMRLQSASYLQRTNNSATGASRKQQRSDEMQGLFSSGTMPREGLYRSGSGKLIQSQQQAEDYPIGSQSMPRPSATDRGATSIRPTVSSLKKQGSGTSQQQQQEQFARSASARLPRKEEDSSLRDGERKREESMKRLLEWKQRMLQSPLTKKIASQHSATMASAESLNPGSSTSVAGDRRHEDIYGMKSEDSLLRGDYYSSTYERQSIGDLTTIGSATARKHGGSVANIAQTSAFGSEMKLNGDYNSYSSDDEASISVRNVFNLPKVALTVKPDPSDPNYLQAKEGVTPGSFYDGMMLGGAVDYYGSEKYIRPDISFESTHDLYTQAQLQRAQELNLQQHYQLQNIDRSLATMQDQQPEDASPQSPMISRGGIESKWSTTPAAVGNDTAGYMNGRMKNESSNERLDTKPLDVSAGDLLNRTHEELILLLIQLRRQNSQTARSIEQCCTNIHELQNLIRIAEGNRKADSLARLDALKQQLTELEKQYEKEKPLINLVDNMVKLGSLYRGPIGGKKQLQSPESATLDRLEFNQRMQERRLLQEEQRQWDRTSPNHVELQSKVQQLYQIDKLMQEESGTLQALQRDKENLEKALATLKTKVLNRESGNMPMAMDTARQQQHTLERELTRVHQLLAANSKKLEKTVSTNARLEQELLVLRQKLQATREHRSMHSVFDSGSTIDNQYMPGSVTAVLESELKRAKLLVGDMQRQRQELGQAVRQLTSYSANDNNGSQLMDHLPTDEQHMQLPPEHQQQRDQQSIGSKHKRSYSSSWVETDLDSLAGKESAAPSNSHRALSSSSSSVLTIDDEMQNLFLPSSRSKDPMEGMESMDELYSAGSAYNFASGTMNAADKQEIKTVRIVKRESERRTRDKEKNDRNLALSLDQVLEEEAQLMEDYQRSKSLPRGYETHELYVQGHETLGADGVMGGAATSMDGSRLMNDYYSSVVASANGNSYPVSLIDRQADLYTGHFETGLQSKYITNDMNSSGGGSRASGLSNTYQANSYLTSGNTGISASALGGLKRKTESIQSLTNTDAELDPVFQSEAAKQIINEMATGANTAVGEISGDSSGSGENKPPATKDEQAYQQHQRQQAQQNRQRRAVPKEKRRHHTAPHHVTAKSIELIHSENDMNKNNVNWRARDDVDLEVTIRPRSNAPDVVRSALGPREKISEHTIDKLLAAPSKILIPERYVPEQTPELSPEEKRRRQEKVEAIKKMLSDTPIGGGAGSNEAGPNPVPNAEKKQREHLIQLNQILAQQVMQMSKIVAENSSAVLPSKIKRKCNAQFGANSSSAGKANDDKDHYESDLEDYDTDSPAEPLPLYQQRENYFT